MRYIACAFVIACGGGSANTSTNQAQGGAGGAQATSSTADAGPTTTTTVLMGDAGELQGTKLETTQGPVNAGGSSNTGPHLDPSQHDPGRSRDDLITIIKSHRDEARACYDTAVKAHPGIQGNIDITWKLDPQGKVVDTGINDSRSDIHDAGLVKCIGDVIRNIHWAASPRGVETTAHYPFNFHPHGNEH